MTNDLVKVEVKNLFRTENSGGGVFLGNDEKTFAIFIGAAELNALILAGGGIVAPRPLTHNLLDMIMSGFSIDVRAVVISDLVDDAFHARLTLVQGGREVEIDCRPSDALVVAMLRKKEVFVTRMLLDKVENGDRLLAALREEVKKGKRSALGPSPAPAPKRAPPSPDEEPRDDRSPEGALGDVRDIPGIDWSGVNFRKP